MNLFLMFVPGNQFQVIAGLDGHVLTLQLDVAVRRTHGNARKGINLLIAPGRLNSDVTAVGRALDAVDAVVVTNLCVTFEALANTRFFFIQFEILAYGILAREHALQHFYAWRDAGQESRIARAWTVGDAHTMACRTLNRYAVRLQCGWRFLVYGTDHLGALDVTVDEVHQYFLILIVAAVYTSLVCGCTLSKQEPG